MEQITLNMIPKGITPICHASQYDKGRVIRLNIMDGLQGYVLSNESVQLNVRKPDMNIVTTDVDTTSGNTFVDIVTTEQMTACEGDNLCEIVLSAGDVVIASLNFIMRVEVDVLKDGIESETEIHNLTTQIQAINDTIVPEMIADQYDSSNVIFDDTPTENHGIGYAVTSEGIKRAIDNVNPDASAVNYDNTDSELTATNAQDAIDEVNDKADTNATAIGDITTLTTEADNLVGAVNEIDSDVTTLQTDKADKTSFTRKSYASTTPFSVNANSIDTRTIAIDNATYGIVIGFAITNASDVVMMQCFFNGLSEIQVRVRNIANYSNTYHLTIFYI